MPTLGASHRPRCSNCSSTLHEVDSGASSRPTAAVLVPVKAFAAAKGRLSAALDPAARAALARQMAARVVAAAAPLPVTVVCDDAEVAAWGRAHGTSVVTEPGRGLNHAVAAGVGHLRRSGTDEVVIAHGDLPWARALSALTGFAGVTLVPDRRRDGTNVICLPSSVPFEFLYGPGSFRRHLAQCQRLGVAVRVVEPPELTFDIDVPADLSVLEHSTPACASRAT